MDSITADLAKPLILKEDYDKMIREAKLAKWGQAEVISKVVEPPAPEIKQLPQDLAQTPRLVAPPGFKLASRGRLRCIMGHVHKYPVESLAPRCISCYGPLPLVRIRKYMEDVFEVPFTLNTTAGAVYNKSLKICVGAEIPGWLNIPSIVQFHVQAFLRKNRDMFPQHIRSRLPPI